MRVFKGLVLIALLVSCGSTKKSASEYGTEDTTVTGTVSSTEETKNETLTSTQSQSSQTQISVTEDSAEVWMVTTTKWYDTSKADSNGIAPLQKTETVASVSFRGKRSQNNSEGEISSESRSALASTSYKDMESGMSAVTAIRTKTKDTSTTSSAKPVKWLMTGIIFAILTTVLVYWAYYKHRAARHIS